MTKIAAETLAKSAGDLYLGPTGTGAPADTELADPAALAALGYVHAGWLDEAGPNLAGFEGSTSKLYGWNSVAAIRSITRVTEPAIEVGLLQWNEENLALYFPGAVYDEPTRTVQIPESGSPTEQELLVVVEDGDRPVGVWVGKVAAHGGGAITFPGDGLAPIPVVFDVLATGDPTAYVHFIGVDPAGELGS